MISVYEKLIELRDASGYTNKQIAQGVQSSESTVKRVFSKKIEDHKRGHSMDLIVSIVRFLGGSLDEIFEYTGVIVGGRNFVEMQEKIAALTSERDKLTEENIGLQAEVAALKNELLHTQIANKDEIISLYKIIHEMKNNNI
jgi:DNA-binding XRE family transcriptional regulator